MNRAAVRRLARRSLPKTNGTIRLRRLGAPVEVIRDRYGIPHIYASSRRDLVRAQGYVHAQDRLFQMEVVRRFAFGRLSELAGARTLDLDRLVRRMRLRWMAEREAAACDPETGALLDAYCEGVNDFIAHERLPLEFRLARTRPEPWQRTDVFAPGAVLALTLSGNWESEIERMRMVERVGPDRARRLEPSYPGDAPVIVPPPLIDDAEQAQLLLRSRLGSGAGSNSWVVAGSRTASAKPILANDPHLTLLAPCVWHVQHVSWDGGTAAGVTLPGVPVVVHGRNERVAWGMTTAIVDTQDLFVERLDRENGLRYEADGEWFDAEVVREEIHVRGRSEPVVEEVVVTRHGPVVVPPERGRAEAFALRWSAHEPGQTARALFELMDAATVEEADAALDGFAAAPHNFVLADVDGGIAYRLAGGPIPRRRAGDGLVPVPGWESTHEWDGWIPEHELPRLRDPERGFIVTANNRIVGDDYAYFLGAEYLNGYRAQRIEELLDGLDAVTVEDCRRIQLDERSLPGLALAEVARDFSSDDPLEQTALDLLARWDGELTAGSAGGAVYGALISSLEEHAYAEVGGARAGVVYRARPTILQMLAARDDSFFADGRTWDGVFREALADAVRMLGPDPGRWNWGERNQVRFEHALGRLPILGRIFNRGPYPAGGDVDTVALLASSPAGAGGYSVGASMRAVFDLGDPDESHIMIAPGQSGHVLSGHYDDLVGPWRAGELVPLAMTRDRVEALAESRLILDPAHRAE
jgi:penicillin amidase